MLTALEHGKAIYINLLYYFVQVYNITMQNAHVNRLGESWELYLTIFFQAWHLHPWCPVVAHSHLFRSAKMLRCFQLQLPCHAHFPLLLQCGLDPSFPSAPFPWRPIVLLLNRADSVNVECRPHPGAKQSTCCKSGTLSIGMLKVWDVFKLILVFRILPHVLSLV